MDVENTETQTSAYSTYVTIRKEKYKASAKENTRRVKMKKQTKDIQVADKSDADTLH